MIKIGECYRTTVEGKFNAGEGNLVCVEAIGHDWIVARDIQNKLYLAEGLDISKLEWGSFLIKIETYISYKKERFNGTTKSQSKVQV